MKNMKKFRAIAVGLVLALVLGTAAMAASGKTVTIFPGVTITVNGTKSTPVDVNGNEVETFIYNNSTYVPLRYFSELMGVNVEWDEATNTVKLSGIPPFRPPKTLVPFNCSQVKSGISFRATRKLPALWVSCAKLTA